MFKAVIGHSGEMLCGCAADLEAVRSANGEEVWLPTRLARMLAVADLNDELFESGHAKNYAEVAKRLGVSRARVAQLGELRWLPIPTQERILSNRPATWAA